MASPARSAAPIVHHAAMTVTAHAWSPDRKELAICPNSTEVWIFSGVQNEDTKSWVKKAVLDKHDMKISSIDWCQVTDRIVTCSHDRTAYVWVREGDKWVAQVAVLRISHGATHVRWSPDGNQFACTSSAKVIPVCRFEPAFKWWVSETIKKHKATILCVAWHPSSGMIATGCADSKCRVISTTDGSTGVGPYASGKRFGSVYSTFKAGSWVEAVAWSDSGHQLVFAGHDATIHVVEFPELAAGGGSPVVQTIMNKELSFTSLAFVSDTQLVAAGHSRSPALFARDGSGVWSLKRQIDTKDGSAKVETSTSSFGAARAMFAGASKRSGGGGGGKDTATWTKHHSAVTELRPYESRTDGIVSKFSTSGLAGRIVIWSL